MSGQRTSNDDANDSNPREPLNLAKCSNACESYGGNSGDRDKGSCACAVVRHSVQANRDTQHSGSGDEDISYDLLDLLAYEKEKVCHVDILMQKLPPNTYRPMRPNRIAPVSSRPYTWG